jgi:hypothetical protein
LQLRIESRGDPFPLNRPLLLAGTHPAVDLRTGSGAAAVRRSPFHAVFVHQVEGITVHDPGTRSGLRVNGRRMRRRQLEVGDRLEFGGILAVVEDSPESDDDGSEWSTRSAAEIAVVEFLGNAGSDRTEATRCHLDVFRRRRHLISAKLDRSASTGASPACDLRLPEPAPLQAALVVRDAGVWYWIRLPVAEGELASKRPVESGVPLELGSLEIIPWLGDAVNSEERTETIALGNAPTPVPPSDSDSVRRRPPAVEESSVNSEDLEIPAEAAEAFREAMAAGHQEFLDGRHREAVAHFRNASRLAPFHLKARKRLRQAQRRWTGAASHRPRYVDLPRIMFHQARTLAALRGGDRREALDRAESGLRFDPWNPGLLLLEAEAFAGEGKWAACLTALEHARLRRPDHPVAHRLMARLAFALGDFPKSIRQWKWLVKRNPKDQEALDGIRAAEVQGALANGLVAGARSE